MDDLDGKWSRLWQLLWTCCDAPTPHIDQAPEDIDPNWVVVTCDNCGALH